MMRLWWPVRLRKGPKAQPYTSCRVYVVLRSIYRNDLLEPHEMGDYVSSEGRFWFNPEGGQRTEVTDRVVYWRKRERAGKPLILRLSAKWARRSKAVRKWYLENFGGGEYAAMRAMKRGYGK